MRDFAGIPQGLWSRAHFRFNLIQKGPSMRLLTLPCLVFMLVACGGENKTPADRDLRLYALDCGSIETTDMAAFDRDGVYYRGQPGHLVDPCYLIRHPKGDLLWDAGLPDTLVGTDGVGAEPFHMTRSKTLKAQLAEIGLTPEDIDYLALSHSHVDHAGNANDFADATWIVDSAEREHMFSDEGRADTETFAVYSALENAEKKVYTDDYDVFGDGRVRIIRTPGHTPGHSSLLLKLERAGAVFLTGDLYHFTETRARRTVPVFNTDPEATLRSMDKFEALAKEENARVVIQHEPADFAALPVFPAFLD
ncbi:MAG: N-acyl homoserine lactonase family protein [Amphiplicatus sp.]